MTEENKIQFEVNPTKKKKLYDDFEAEQAVGHDTVSEKVENDTITMNGEEFQKIINLPRTVRRHRKLLGVKIIKKVMKGHNPRKIARKLGYINIDQGEVEIKNFISAYLKQ